ncbi:alpha/beta fold hydrolase [Propioniciclava soli]|uniref:Alpha/beta fold hydrolase n=1 Tax=Propioniciclava soli TaxID=2775081 RepID=A0ABZ3CBJ6_9ACTN
MNRAADWILDDRAPGAQCELLCLPHAGGSSLSYREWQGWAPDWMTVRAVELPGRGRRFGEPPLRRMHLVAGRVAAAIAAQVDRPFALFGHSMGALIAFETARVLADRGGPLPCRLFLSAMAAPVRNAGRGEALHAASDGVLIERLRSYDGTPPEVLANPDLLGLVLPIIRADFEMLETYRIGAGEPLDVPVTVLGGREDALVGPADLLRWREYAPLAGVRTFDGGHFYLTEHGPGVVDHIAAELAGSLVGTPA